MVYYYYWTWESATKESYDTSAVETPDGWQPPTDPFLAQEPDIITKAEYTVIASITDEFVKQFATKGITINVTKIECEPWIETKEEIAYGVKTWKHYLHINGKTWYESDTDLFKSPLDPITAALIAKIIAILLNALLIAFAVTLFFKWLESMTTTKTTITKYNPQTGEIITEETTQPSPTGIFTVFLAIGGLVIAIWVVRKIRKGK